ncbi:hypothetical protein [Pseudomonas azotoformans]|uniref:hypothetical protein n=1 Tax=Pseudomonas azotoformans TaxID=47878 RepID=UPI000A557274|nr:hypothetical protein [Pseudomonas azotoformans]
MQLPDEGFEAAQQEADFRLEGDVQFYRLFKHGTISTPADNFKLRHVEIEQQVELYMSPDAVLIRLNGAPWQRHDESL